ncbi:MAG: hypothetical protein B6I20_12330 [Bacteroidetes bacterium 4572_117]|nr:MAG: hypothetical protein B6I20_12330 [Bacteroidetes bacterium 4572_117]
MLVSCNPKPINPLENILSQKDTIISNVIKRADEYKVQIIYTQTDRDSTNAPIFTDFDYLLDSSAYFYPASMVKMPIAFLALEKLNELKKQGFPIDKFTALEIDSVREFQSSVKKDSTSKTGYANIANYIKKVFLVSDNDAYNRLFEFLGRDYINAKLKEKGITPARITHRLSSFNSNNKYTNPITFFADSVLYRQEEIISEKKYLPLIVNKTLKGKGYINKNDELVNEKMDFSQKNYFPLKSLHKTLQRIIFPNYFPDNKQFNLSDSDYEFLYKSMGMLPVESDFPKYDNKKYYDSYVKFFMFGNSKNNIPKNIRVLNKVGRAYGYLIDCAYIVDFDNKVEFFLSAVIHVNENRVFNDDKYEYEQIGFPFLAELGRKIYEHELQREKKIIPDLSKLERLYE